ncbi:Coiled-coil domain-containing protein 84 [Phytophthora cactorum]|nr:Coiled-coil domain-containing protein 84 [Phytophthora cactorum]
MTEDDAVEAPYCVVCRRSSSGKWRKHVFSRSHQQAAQQFLLHQVSRLQALRSGLTNVLWRCVFCDAALATADAPKHFGGESHRKQVETFCRQHRCDADRQTRPQLWLNAAQRREAALAKREAGVEEQEKLQEEVETVDQASSQRVEAFLSSAASRLEEVESKRRRGVEETPVDEVATREQQDALLGHRRPDPGAARHSLRRKAYCRTLSVVMTARACGALRKAEWIPWPIDQLVREEQTDHPEVQQTGVDNASFVHRMTELARGEGLSSIASVTWGASVGNVHTAAVPPWMVQTEEEYKQCNRRAQETPPPALPTKWNNKAETKDKKRRDIFSELQAKSDYGPDWLPNFGGVWQEGPRSMTKQAPPHSAHRRSFQTPTRGFKLDSIRVPQSHSKSTNPLDAKKQSLLAQKERLRAKMAARRRQ